MNETSSIPPAAQLVVDAAIEFFRAYAVGTTADEKDKREALFRALIDLEKVNPEIYHALSRLSPAGAV